jgi:hypothetical protein
MLILSKKQMWFSIMLECMMLICLSFLKPLPEGFSQTLDGNINFLDPELPSSMVISIAEGQLDPITMEAFDEFPQIPSSLGHQAVYSNKTASFQNQSEN